MPPWGRADPPSGPLSALRLGTFLRELFQKHALDYGSAGRWPAFSSTPAGRSLRSYNSIQELFEIRP